MVSFLSSLAFLAALPNAADTATLLVRWTSPQCEAPITFTLDDVKPGPLPGLLATGSEGSEYLIHLALELPAPSEGDQPKVVIDAKIRELTADKKGRAYLKMLSAPRLMTDVGTPASIFQGGELAVPGTDPVQWREVGMKLEVMYFDGAAPTATASASP
jgi:hypothetical protein